LLKGLHYRRLAELLQIMWANLLVVPFSSLLIYALLGLLVLSVWAPAAAALGYVIGVGIHVMNGFVYFIGDLPLSVFHLHHFGLLRAFVVALVIGLLYAFVTTRRAVHLQLALTALVGLFAVATYHTFADGRVSNVTAFRHGRDRIVSIRNGYDALLLRSKSVDFRTGAFDRYLEQYYEREGVRNVKQAFFEDSDRTARPFDWLQRRGNVCTVGKRSLVFRPNGVAWLGAHEPALAAVYSETPFILTNPIQP